jgi:hypothetical protein
MRVAGQAYYNHTIGDVVSRLIRGHARSFSRPQTMPVSSVSLNETPHLNHRNTPAATAGFVENDVVMLVKVPQPFIGQPYRVRPPLRRCVCMCVCLCSCAVW